MAKLKQAKLTNAQDGTVTTVEFEDLLFMALNDLAAMATETAKSKGFSKGKKAAQKAIPERLVLMHSELSEALEEHRAGRGPTEVYSNDGSAKPEGIPVEIADLVIRALHFCGELGIDLGAAVKLKMAYNKTRPFKHGKKY